MKNYICTAKGFVKSAGFNGENHEFVIEYTEKLREAKKFNTKTAQKFILNHEIEGFIWKPFAQEAVRGMYEVKQRYNYGFEEREDKIMEWMPVKITMGSDSDVSFLMSNKLKADDAMTFEEAKTKALELNMIMVEELKYKISDITHQTEKL